MRTLPFSIQNLISLPPAMAESFANTTGLAEPEWVAACDPLGGKLGSGGGIAHLMATAWNKTGGGSDFPTWLEESSKLLLMAGGQSRRLPAYALTGKLLIPIPVLRWANGQRLDQTLMDLQTPSYRSVLAGGAPHYRALVTSGDVMLHFESELPELPQVDVLGLGMWVRPEVAGHFGVFFSPRHDPNQWAFFRQKPSAEEIRELARGHFYLVDTGMWLLSARAVEVLMGKCGWLMEQGKFADGVAREFELYSGFGLSLGTTPHLPDPEVSSLSCAVVPLPGAEFYHLGTSRQLIESVSLLQNRQLDQTKLGGLAARPHPDQYILNSAFTYPRRLEQNHTLWVENSTIPATWELESDHVLTGVPNNEWALRLEAGVCLDFVPVGEAEMAVRFYGMDDEFRGEIGQEASIWLGRSAPDWFATRGISWVEAGIDSTADLQRAALFPIVKTDKLQAEFLRWLTAKQPVDSPQWKTFWLECSRASAEKIGEKGRPDLLLQQRQSHLEAVLPAMASNYRGNPFYRLDLDCTARLYAQSGAELPPVPKDAEPMTGVHDAMFRAAVLRYRGESGDEALEVDAFRKLRDGIIGSAQMQPVHPRCTALEDQIIWGRSPVRIDLAGGWSDTPPYCLNHGGRVVNLAVDLNGQPPIQVFARRSNRPELVIRSIDLGVESRIGTFEELDDFSRPDSEFALAKAALALVGFLPRFHEKGGADSLEKQLAEFGGGLEVSLLAAVPKGSGLGTSSILAATLLGVLSEFCGLGWDQATISARTLALEQMLTTGGGWQDQIGGITRGIKMIETTAGLAQTPAIRWLPEHLFGADRANRTALLYYTGITRMAKNILQEIVRGMFLNRQEHLETIGAIKDHANRTYQALQEGNWEGVCSAVRRSWELNQRLDAGTNPPAVAEILERVSPWLAAAKLPGAGGGGYLLMLARDEDAAAAIRRTLAENPPNPRTRFVDFRVSDLGLQITRS